MPTRFARGVIPLPLFRVLHLAALFALLIQSTPVATAQSAAGTVAGVEKGVFGRTADGTVVEQFTLTNQRGALARIITFGAIVADLRMPDREGRLASVVREITPSEQGFQRGFSNSAAVFGRVANRIAHARFTLDGREYAVTRNA